jgi:glycosyltransferase involved in cell wall biosynthesis
VRILVLTDNFVPEIAAPCFRIRDHARFWLEQGHDVTVVTCAPNWPHGKVFSGYRNRLYQEERVDGIRVIRLWTYMTANKGFLKRTLDYLSFMFSAIAFCWRYPRFDVVLATSPQFFSAVAGCVISILRRRPWVFELRDLWPESIKAVGAGKGRIIGWLERLEMSLYRRAHRIIAVTHSFKQNLADRRISRAKIDVITNGVDGRRFAPTQASHDVRQRFGVAPGAMLAGYIGTTGMAHGLETLLAAAKRCGDRPEIQFVIMGDGAEREKLEWRAQQLGLRNMRFADRVPHEELARYYAALDLSIVHLKPAPVFKTVIPSKIFELMAMEVPILMAVEGEGAQIVREAGCGVCIRSGDPVALADAVTRLAADRRALRAMGRRGRSTAIRKYERRDKAAAVLDSLETAIQFYRTKAYPEPLRVDPTGRDVAGPRPHIDVEQVHDAASRRAA